MDLEGEEMGSDEIFDKRTIFTSRCWSPNIQKCWHLCRFSIVIGCSILSKKKFHTSISALKVGSIVISVQLYVHCDFFLSKNLASNQKKWQNWNTMHQNSCPVNNLWVQNFLIISDCLPKPWPSLTNFNYTG